MKQAQTVTNSPRIQCRKMLRAILTSIALKSVSSLDKVTCEDYQDKLDSNFCKGRKNGVYPFNDDSCSLYYNCYDGMTSCQSCDLFEDKTYFSFNGETGFSGAVTHFSLRGHNRKYQKEVVLIAFEALQTDDFLSTFWVIFSPSLGYFDQFWWYCYIHFYKLRTTATKTFLNQLFWWG